MNFTKFTRTPFFTEHLWWLLLYFKQFCRNFNQHIFFVRMSVSLRGSVLRNFTICTRVSFLIKLQARGKFSNNLQKHVPFIFLILFNYFYSIFVVEYLVFICMYVIIFEHLKIQVVEKQE